MESPIKYIFVLEHSCDQKATFCQTPSKSVSKWLEATKKRNKNNPKINNNSVTLKDKNTKKLHNLHMAITNIYL